MSKPLPQTDLDDVLAATSSLWPQMRNQRLFLTGGTGFFGMWLVETFLHANRMLGLNAHVTVLTRNPEAFARKAAHLIADPALSLLKGDVREFPFPAGEYSHVIHAATEASAKQLAEAPSEMLATIVDGTRHILDFATTHGAQKFLLTSSGGVYGRQPARVAYIAEEYAGAPDPLDPGQHLRRRQALVRAAVRVARPQHCV